VLRYLATALHPNGQLDTDVALFELLHLALFAVPPADLARLAIGHHYHRRMASAAGRPVLSWRLWAYIALADLALLAPRPSTPHFPTPASLSYALALLDGWVQAATLPRPALLERVVLGTLLPVGLTHATQPAQLLAEVRTLLRWGRVEARRVSTAGVAELLAAWETLATTREGLPLEPGSKGGAARLELLTAHHGPQRQGPGIGAGVAAGLPAKHLAA
jgi:hypothetical protein